MPRFDQRGSVTFTIKDESDGSIDMTAVFDPELPEDKQVRSLAHAIGMAGIVKIKQLAEVLGDVKFDGWQDGA